MIFGPSVRSTKRFRTAACCLVMAGLSLSLASCSSGTSSTPSTTVVSAQVQTLLREGIAASNAGHYQQAKNLFGQVIRATPLKENAYQALAYYNLGVINQKLGNTSRAIAQYKVAVKFAPKFASAWYNLAIAQTKDSPADALASYNKVLAVKANDANSLFNSGLLMYAQGDAHGGATRINEAIKLNPRLASRVPASINLAA